MAGLTCTPWCAPAALPEEQQDAPGAAAACQAATDILYAATGRRWRGECDRSVTLETTCPGGWGDARRITLGHGRPIGRGPTWRLELPDYPVREVTAAAEYRDGPAEAPTALTSGEYRLVNGKWLERLVDGLRVAWVGYDLALDYTYGMDPPDGGVRAAVEYATQLLLAGTEACKLPDRVVQIVRQNVSYTFADPEDYLAKGRTGVPSVDAWIAAVNPAGLKQRPRVWSPDTQRTTARYGT